MPVKKPLSVDAIAKLNVVLLRCATRAERNNNNKPITLGDRIFQMSEKGMSPRQIADALDLNRDDVNRSIYRTRKRMKKATEVAQ